MKMKNFDILWLFFVKEGAELSGRKKMNLIWLSIVFLVAVISVGFASASLSYLRFKMDDPFINWVDIVAQQNVGNDKKDLVKFLNDSAVQKHYNFVDPQPNYVQSMFFRVHGDQLNAPNDRQLEGRTIGGAIGINSPVLERILKEDNVVHKNRLPYSDGELGLIITQEALRKIGYDDKYPYFVQVSRSYDLYDCRQLGLGDGLNGFYPVSFPVYAIVKQLPGMYSFLFTSRFWNDLHSQGATWDITDEENNECLLLCGTESAIGEIKEQIKDKDVNISESDYCGSWAKLKCLKIEVNEGDVPQCYSQMVSDLNIDNMSVYRIYNFSPVTNYYQANPSYYSIQMNSLDSIRAFQEKLFNECGIKLDMTNVEAKENFSFVQKMGNILSVCIIVISIIFLCAFIYFLLRSHFQKIQKNLGTFKAFGISNRTLVWIYLSLMVSMLVLAFAIAFIVALVVAFVMSLFTCIEQGYPWLDVSTWQNWVLFGVAVLASVVTTLLVTRKLLIQTPGDLIYQRKNDKQ